MSAPPEIVHVVRQWVEKAEGDLRGARHMLKLENNCPFHIVCFLAQQCAEKYLKALLTLQSIPFPKTHELWRLFLMLKTGANLKLEKADLIIVTRYAADSRYPGEFDPLSRDDAEEAVAIAQDVRKAVRAKLPQAALRFGKRKTS